MAFVIGDRVRETSTTTGTGSFTLAGAVTGYQTFDTVLNTSDTTYYTIADQSGANFEVGIGTFTAPATLARTTILSSSNGGSVVTFGAGTKDVFISLPASKTVQSFSAGSTGLTPSTASFGAVSLAGTLVPANGGTGTATAFTAGSVVFAGASGVYAQDNASLFFDDTNNRLGIGTSSPAYKLDINSITGWGANQTAPIANIVGANAPTNGGGNLRVLSNTSATADAGGSLVLGGYYTAQTNSIDYAEISGRKQTGQTTGGYLALSTRADLGNETERLRITSAGDVGIGTSSPSQKLEVYAAANSLQIESIVRNDQAGSGVAAIGFNVSSGAAAEATSTKAGIGLVRSAAFGGGSLCFYNNNSGAAGDFTTADEKMRIDSSGSLLVDTTTNDTSSRISTRATSAVINGVGVYCTTTAATGAMVFFNPNGQVGTIQVTGSATAYITSSDYRLKENVAPITNGLTTIASLKPVTYDWKNDASKGEGFIAHELQSVIPAAVSGEKDAINKDGSIKPQGVDYSKIVVHLVAAIQELKADFDAYKAAHP